MPTEPTINRRDRRAAKAHERHRARRIDRALAVPPKLADAPAGSLSGPQTICLAMIVRDESGPHLFRCLDSVRPFVTAWAIVDTGSTDGTQDAIREYMRDIPGVLIGREWVDDFARSRNQSLDLARASGAEFALTIDADDHLVPHGLRAIGDRIQLPALQRLTAAVTIFAGIDEGRWRPTFLRLAAPIRWHGHLHEFLLRDDGSRPTGVVNPGYMMRVTRDGAASRDMLAKAERYFEICRRWVEIEPDDSYGWECLAREFLRRGDRAETRRSADEALRLIPESDTHRRYVVGLIRVMTIEPFGSRIEEISKYVGDLIELCPERAEAPRWFAQELRGVGRVELAARVDAIADEKTPPEDAWRVALDCYRRSAS